MTLAPGFPSKALSIINVGKESGDRIEKPAKAQKYRRLNLKHLKDLKTAVQSGHFARQCPTGIQSHLPSAPTKTVCPRCRRGLHWAKECRSKTTIEGTPLLSSPREAKQAYDSDQGSGSEKSHSPCIYQTGRGLLRNDNSSGRKN